jgi:hypothetical protein
MSSIPQKLCGVCEKPLDPRHKKYCSAACYGIAQRKPNVDLVCEHCNCAYFPDNRYNAKRQRFCSHDCSRAWKLAHRPVVTCGVCGKQYSTHASTRNYRKHCSRECSNKAATTRVAINCLSCGKSFETFPSMLKRGWGKYCSHGCYGRAGAANPRWYGGKSFEPYPTTFNIVFKRIIRERDNYTCAVCGKANSRHVHHIDYDKANTTVDNCVTTCSSCHSKTNGNREFWTRYFLNYMRVHVERNT